MLRVLAWGLAIVVLVLVADRVLLRMESRGWVYYRRTRKRGGGALYHMMELHSVFDPQIKQVIEAKYHEEEAQDESGDPPVPEDADDGPAL